MGSMDRLVDAVLDGSAANTWDRARLEWVVDDFDLDEDDTAQCVCGHLGLRWIYTIANVETGAVLTPIGSVCIGHFGNSGMDKEAADLRLLAELEMLVESHVPLDLKEHFTKAHLDLLCERGALDDEGFAFLLKMFNRRNPMTPGQLRYVDALLRRHGGVRWWLQQRIDARE